MKKRLFIFLVLFSVLLVSKAPATLLDALFARLSSNAFHLVEAEGTLWQGRGLLVGSDAVLHTERPWLHLRWKFQPAALLGGGLGWSFADGDKALGDVSYGLRGLHLKQVNLTLPAEIVRLPLENPVFNSGWRGNITLEAPEWTWRTGEGNLGRVEMRWLGAGTAFFPGRRLGDYSVKLVGEGDKTRFFIMTLGGDVQVSGSGSLSQDGHLNYDGRIEGDPDLLRSLPAVSANMVREDGAAGRYIVQIPAR